MATVTITDLQTVSALNDAGAEVAQGGFVSCVRNTSQATVGAGKFQAALEAHVAGLLNAKDAALIALQAEKSAAINQKNARIDELQADKDRLQGRVDVLRAKLDAWALNGVSPADKLAARRAAAKAQVEAANAELDKVAEEEALT